MFVLSSSNDSKIAEFKRILGDDLTIIKGKDLKEVNGTADEVIIYKTLEAGIGHIVEDTILTVDGVEVVDIRWDQEDKLKNAKDAIWTTSLGFTDGMNVFIARGEIQGTIIAPTVDGFGFDPYFLPDGSDKSLAELELNGDKDKFSARYIALLNLKNSVFCIKKDANNIPAWTGTYQNQK